MKLLLILCLGPAIAMAGRIELQDGSVVSGTVVAVVPAVVQVETGTGTVSIPLDSLAIQSQRAILGREGDSIALKEAYQLINAQKQLIAALNDSLRLKGAAMPGLEKHLQPARLPSPISYGVRAPQNVPQETDAMPSSLLAGIKAKAEFDHPGDPSTQLYVVTTNVESWKKLKTFPDSSTKRKAAADFPLDFTTQLYVVETAEKAARDLSNVR